MNAVRFVVAYQLGEYRKFALEHVRHVRGKPLGAISRAALSLFTLPLLTGVGIASCG